MSQQITKDSKSNHHLELIIIESIDQLPPWLNILSLAQSFYDRMKPYNDELDDTKEALRYALGMELGVKSEGSSEERAEKCGCARGGFLVLAIDREKQYLAGGLVMLKTGMSGYIPPWLLLMVFVDEGLRGAGLGKRIIERALARTDGDVKLHVEHANPARHLYERLGFTSKYLDMRLTRQGRKGTDE